MKTTLIYLLGALSALLLCQWTHTCQKPHLDERTPTDSSLIEQLNYHVNETARLENYIKQLEEENQILGSTLAQRDYDDYN